jgi:hypothetical protein
MMTLSRRSDKVEIAKWKCTPATQCNMELPMRMQGLIRVHERYFTLGEGTIEVHSVKDEGY